MFRPSLSPPSLLHSTFTVDSAFPGSLRTTLLHVLQVSFVAISAHLRLQRTSLSLSLHVTPDYAQKLFFFFLTNISSES